MSFILDLVDVKLIINIKELEEYMLLWLKVAILVRKGLAILLYIAFYIVVKNNKNFATRSRVRKERYTLGMLVLLSLYSY